MSYNRAGTAESSQVSKMGVLDISNSNFKSDLGFCIKNDGDEPVTLEVCLWEMPDGEFVETVFDCGWNPEIVKCVKQQEGDFNIKWGY